MPFSEEVVLAPPAGPVIPRHARSTVLLGSIAVVRASGRFDEYCGHLTPPERTALVDAVVGTWIPLDIARAHYAACDRLSIPQEQAFSNGRANFHKTGGALLGTVIRMAKGAGVTPWVLYPRFQRFWERAYDGGAVGVYKIGPKEARVELTHFPLLESPYFREAVRGLITSVIELFCRKAYMVERGRPLQSSVVWRIQWV